MGSQEFNLPNKDDPNFSDKVVGLIKQLFEKNDQKVQNLEPISTPDDSQPIGSYWYDADTEKIKVNTTAGIKTLKYE